MDDSEPRAYRIVRQIGDVEHVFVVVAMDQTSAKRMVAELNGWRHNGYAPGQPPHPWNPKTGTWSVMPFTEDYGAIKLYEFNRKTGDMKL